MTTTPMMLATLLVLGAPAVLRAQTEGPLTGTPAVVLVQPGTTGPGGALAADTLHRKTAGFVPYAPNRPSPGPMAPVYTTTAMFGGGIAPPAFEIDAFSTGLDCLMATPPAGGVSFTFVPPGAWGAVLFSVTPGTSGAPGSVISEQTGAPDGAAADFFTLVVPGSFLPPSVAPCYPQDRPQLALDSPDMGLFAPSTPGDVSALDIYVPLYHAGPPITLALPPAPTVYFSVSNDAIMPPGGGPSLVPPAWFAGSAPSGATILKTTWIPMAGVWSVPTPHIAYFDLGLLVDDDVDALAVDEGKCLLLFSIVKTATSTLAQQLQVASWPKPSSPGDMGVTTGVYVTSGGGEPMAARARIGDDGDIDGTCLIDPSGEQTGGSVGIHFAYGSPVLAITNEKTLGAGLYRDEAFFGLPTLTPTVHGVPTTPMMPPQRLELWFAYPTLGPYVIFPTPIYVELLTGAMPLPYRTLPLSAPLVGAVVGAQVDFFWIVQGKFPRPSSPVLRISI